VIRPETVVVGEVGLAAEVRSVVNIALRVNEAQKLGFKTCILPKSNHQACQAAAKKDGMKLLAVDDLAAVFRHLWQETTS